MRPSLVKHADDYPVIEAAYVVGHVAKRTAAWL
jgi:hypothetical protein